MKTNDRSRAASEARKAHRQRSRSGTGRVDSSRDVERLIEEARNLVPIFARRYQGRGVSFEDLVGAGNLGVVEAAHRFDPDRGVKFGSYAVWWIRKAIVEALGTGSSVITTPRYSVVRRWRVMDAINRGRSPGERDLSPSDVAAGLGLSTRQAERAYVFAVGSVSLVAPVSADSDLTWGDRLAGSDEGPEAAMLDDERARAAREALSALSPRQRLVVMLRFGGGKDQEPASLKDVGRLMGLSSERIRQIEGEALDVVRHKLARDARKRSRGHRHAGDTPKHRRMTS